MRNVSKKRRRRNAEAKPVRDRLVSQADGCETCGRGPHRPHRGMAPSLSTLCCHEIANGQHRNKAIDKPFAILVLCFHCNGHVVTDKSVWPESRQLSVLSEKRPEDYDLAAYNDLINPSAPNRITEEEVSEHHKQGKRTV